MTCIFDDLDGADEHVPLLDKWLYEGLSEDELARLPTEVRQRFAAHIRKLFDEARRDVEAGRVVDGPTAMQRMRETLINTVIDSGK